MERVERAGDGRGLYDTPTVRQFAELGGPNDIPDETTILNFRSAAGDARLGAADLLVGPGHA